MKGPNFFIIGAPKCGTTSLAYWLGEHPNIYIPPVKEPHYYSDDLKNRTVRTERAYSRIFSRVDPNRHRAIGEASTWYLYSRNAVPAIEKARPGSRYIVMTRDPIEMARSLHHHNLRVLHESEQNFEQAWGLQAERELGRYLPVRCTEPAFLQYRKVCSLGTQLQGLMERVPAERILHVPLSALQAQPAETFKRVLDFLELPDDRRSVFPVVNEARGYRSRSLQQILRLGGRIRLSLGIHHGLGLARINERPRSKQVLSDEFRGVLERAFSEERRVLSVMNDLFQ